MNVNHPPPLNVSYNITEGHYRPHHPRPYCGLQAPKLPEEMYKLPASQQVPLLTAHNIAMRDYEAGLAQYREEILAYRTAEAELEALFKHDLFEELGISDNSKREIFFEKVWELGSGDGLNRVLELAEMLVELIAPTEISETSEMSPAPTQSLGVCGSSGGSRKGTRPAGSTRRPR